jgi:prepilin-type N-terminal cleavage/methylation domain-containing protein
MSSLLPKKTSQSGFTLIELLVVIGIIAVLIGLSTINLGKAQTTASLSSTVSTLLSDLRNEQILAMTGDMGSTTSQQPHGIYVQSTSYTLFADASYNSSDTANYTVNVSPDTLSTTFPSDQVVYNVGDGSVANFSSGNNTITITDNGASQTITINRFGATTVN